VQRGDGRWQVHIRHKDKEGRSRRYTVYGSTPKEARAKASAVRERLRANLATDDVLPRQIGEERGRRRLERVLAPGVRSGPC
jgi:integrase